MSAGKQTAESKHPLNQRFQWKEIEDQFESSHKQLHSLRNSLKRKFKELEVIRRLVEDRTREVEAREAEAEEKILQVEKFRVTIESKLREFEEREERCVEIRVMEREVSERLREVEERERKCGRIFEELKLRESEVEEENRVKGRALKRRFLELELKERKVEDERRELRLKEEEILGLREEVELMRKELEVEFGLVGKRFGGIELKEKEIEGRCKEIELKEKEVKGRCKELESKEKEIEGRCREVELKEKFIDRQCKEIELMEKRIEQRCRDVELKEKEFDGWYKEVEVKEKEFDGRCKELELKEKELYGRCKEAELKEKRIEGWCKELESKEKELEVELKGKKMVDPVNVRVKSEPVDDNVINQPVGDASLCFMVKMDGKALQIFLNERWKVHGLLRNEVKVALGMSLDPAKLILDAMQGFYHPFLKKGEVEFEEDVVRRSCILLLELLVQISPEIRPYVKNEAMKLAFEWMTKMRVDAEHSLEVLGFLQLLASYGLASAFDDDELLEHLEIVAHHNQAPELFRVLGFADKISGFVQNLMRKKNIEAVRFVYAFDLVNEFPPALFLKEYLKNSKIAAGKIMKGDNFIEARIEATNKKLLDLRVVLRCIEYHKLESEDSELSSEKLKVEIDILEKKLSVEESTLSCKSQSTYMNEEKCLGQRVDAAATSICALKDAFTTSTVLNSPTIASTAALASKTDIKHPWAAVSAGDDPSASGSSTPGASSELLHFDRTSDSSSLGLHPLSNSTSGESSKLPLSKDESPDSMHGENSTALESVPKSAKLVLDAIKHFCSMDLKVNKDSDFGVPLERCMFSLKQLRKVSPKIKPHVKEEARNFAFDWKSKMKKRVRGQWEVELFVEFLVTYGLAFSFAVNDLLYFLHGNLGPEKCSVRCQVLGLGPAMPAFIQSLTNSSQQTEAIKYIYALKMEDKISPVGLLRDYLHIYEKIASKLHKYDDSKIKAQVKTITKMIRRLRNAVNCIESYEELKSEFPIDHLKEKIAQLGNLREEKVRSIFLKAETGPCTRSELLQQQQEKKNPNNTVVTTTEIGPIVISSSSTIASAASSTLPITASPPTPTDGSAPPTAVTSSSNDTAADPTASTSVTAPTSTISPPSANTSNTQPPDNVQQKRRRLTVTSGPPAQQFHQRPVWHVNQHAAYMPPGPYGFDGQPPISPQAYYSNMFPFYPWNNAAGPGYGVHPMPFWRP